MAHTPTQTLKSSCLYFSCFHGNWVGKKSVYFLFFLCHRDFRTVSMCGIDRGCKEVTFNKYLCNLVFQFHTSLCRADHVVMLDLQFYRSGATNKRGSNLEALSFSFLLSLSLSLFCVWFGPFLPLFALGSSPVSCPPLTPTHTFRNIREHPNNSSQVQFGWLIYSWLRVSLTPIFLLLMSFFWNSDTQINLPPKKKKKARPPHANHGIVSYQKQQQDPNMNVCCFCSVLTSFFFF